MTNQNLIDLNAMFNTALQKVIDEKTVEKAIEDNLNKTVSYAVEQALGRWGNFSKSIETAMKESFGFNPNELKLDDYRGMIIEQVRGHLDQHFGQQLTERITQDIDRLTSLAPDEIKLSELRKKFEEHIAEELDIENPDDELPMMFEWEEGTTSSFRTIKMELKRESRYRSLSSSNEDKYELRLFFKDDKRKDVGEVYAVNIEGDRWKHGSAAQFSDWGRFVASMLLRETKVIVDEELL